MFLRPNSGCFLRLRRPPGSRGPGSPPIRPRKNDETHPGHTAFGRKTAQSGRSGSRSARTETPPIRYIPTAGHADGSESAVQPARDTVTDRAVVLKTVSPAAALHEAQCLLVLPPGAGPRLLDFAGRADGRMTLALESVDGLTLDEAALTMPSRLLPRLAQALCQCLVHVHRTGWIHADISPTNVLVRRTRGDLRVRLVDFGYAIDRFAAPIESQRGGTLPYVAPELAQGWILDGRADLYSLGVILRDTLPSLLEDRRWTPIVQGLCARLPADRYPHAAAARDEISRVFGLPPSPDPWPRFGAGAVCGRDRLLVQVLAGLGRRNARVLVQARPGIGLTRFLLEAAVRSAHAGRPVRMVDLPDLARDSDAAFEYLEECLRSSDPVLCGIDDPSPGLRWMSGPNQDRLRGILNDPRWTRVHLPPIDEHDLEDMVLAGLGSRDPSAELLVRALFERFEGNLRFGADGFGSFVRRCGVEHGIQFRLDPERLRKRLRVALSRREMSPGAPVPERLVPALRTCALAGTSFPIRIGRGLLQRFHSVADLDDLLDHGLLVHLDHTRLRFLTRALWEWASSGPKDRQADIDRWLHEHLLANPDRVDDSIDAAARARRLGDSVAESRYLARAMTRADRQRRWRDALRILAYPNAPPTRWSGTRIAQQAAKLGHMLNPEWTTDLLLVLAGTCLSSLHQELGITLLDRAAANSDSRGSAAALLVLADHWVNRPERTNFDRCLAALRSRSVVPGAVAPGTLDYFTARRRWIEDEPGQAARLAERADRDLRGSGILCEALNTQLLAILRFPSAPGEGLRTMKRALTQTWDPELRAQTQHNLALMYGQLGRPADAAACVDQGLRAKSSEISYDRLLGLRIRRAWSWAGLDRIDQAYDAANALLASAAVRAAVRHLVPTRILIGHCLLHRGEEAQAVRVQVRTWLEASEKLPALGYQCLPYLIDALLAAEDWATVQAHGSQLDGLDSTGDPATALAAIRAHALVALADGRPLDALAALDENLSAARSLRTRTDAAGYLHQTAATLLRSAPGPAVRTTARRACRLFREEMEMLPRTGYTYYRARSLLGFSDALHHAGQHSESRRTLSRAIALARRAECRSLLKRGLERRAGVRPTNEDGVG